MRDKMINAFKAYATGQLEKHKANVEVYLANPAGIGEHSDVMAALEEEIKQIAEYSDMLEVVENHFS